MASSDFRSAFHHFTGSPLIGFTFTRYRGLAPHGCVAWCRDGSLPFRDGLCDHSDPSTPTGSWVLHFQVLRTVHGLRYPCAELGSRFVLLAQVGDCDAAGFLIVRTDHSLAPQGDLVVALRRSDLSFRPATSYRAAWSLPWPDSHRRVHHSFVGTHHTALRRASPCRMRDRRITDGSGQAMQASGVQ